VRGVPEEEQELIGGESRTLYIPLQFFFCTNPGLALPLIALQYHEVRLKFELAAAIALVKGGDDTKLSMDCELYVDYIYLDTDERRKMAQASHEFLITQLQMDHGTQIETEGNANVRLNFNHPVKELIWTLEGGNDGSKDHAMNELQPIVKANLSLNGHERFQERDGDYFKLVQPYQHHTRIPRNNIYVYSFALKPEEYQPSGSCNFSRIDNAQLKVTAGKQTLDLNFDKAASLRIFATNWNVLRIMSGMGGMAFSN
jgi:hypothetical protein